MEDLSEIDEAIKHCEEIASRCGDTVCGTDHLTFASWLRELKLLRAEVAEKDKEIAKLVSTLHACRECNAMGV